MTGFSEHDLDGLDALLRETARSHIMPSFKRLSAGAVRRKTGPLDLVTDADEAAEAVITQALLDRYPNCVVVGEEAASRDPSLMGRIAGARLAFVVDPVDGTANFVAGLPLFGTMAAVIVDGEVAASVIHDPVTGHSALALAGQGAWEQSAEGGRSKLSVAAPVPVNEMTGMVSWRYLPDAMRGIVLPNLSRLAQIWDFRCAAHQYRMLAAGHCHMMLFNRLMPWDHLPGWLLHREAGGTAAKFDGSPYRPGEVEGGLICAPDPASWEALRRALLLA